MDVGDGDQELQILSSSSTLRVETSSLSQTEVKQGCCVWSCGRGEKWEEVRFENQERQRDICKNKCF